jgi:hypothetical protein
MQTGLRININMLAPAYAAPGSGLRQVPPGAEITAVSLTPEPDEEVPDEDAAPVVSSAPATLTKCAVEGRPTSTVRRCSRRRIC